MFITIERAIQKLRKGEMLILVDDKERENEGDLVLAAEFVTAEAINFMATHGRGLICTPITAERARQLELAPMCPQNTDPQSTQFTVSVDAREGISTGISAPDRARTIARLVDGATQPDDLMRPGHVFPLVARGGGVLCRPGHTEASLDLVKLADLAPVAVLCEILNEDGTMARLPQLGPFAAQHGLSIVRIADLIADRTKHAAGHEVEGKPAGRARTDRSNVLKGVA